MVHLEDPRRRAGRLLLFVATDRRRRRSTTPLRGRIGAALRRELSPRHVPDVIEAVPAVPRTLTGKKLEAPVKQILLGRPATEVISPDDAVTGFDALAAFRVP